MDNVGRALAQAENPLIEQHLDGAAMGAIDNIGLPGNAEGRSRRIDQIARRRTQPQSNICRSR
jgi:hypothetical protein